MNAYTDALAYELPGTTVRGLAALDAAWCYHQADRRQWLITIRTGIRDLRYEQVHRDRPYYNNLQAFAVMDDFGNLVPVTTWL